MNQAFILDNINFVKFNPLIVKMEDIKKFNDQVFPIVYSQAFYERLRKSSTLSLMATLQGFGIIGMITTMASEENKDDIYIMTLGVRKEFRKLSIATMLLGKILKTYHSVVLDVKNRNEEAMSLYLKFGFTCNGIKKNYYLVDGKTCDSIRMRYRKNKFD
jgi:ribosomal protein S18 acetylase RimI-like enzyme